MTDAGGFDTFGGPHLGALGVTLALLAAVRLVARRGSDRTRVRVARVLAGVLLGNEFLWWTVRIVQLGWWGWIQNHLPLHVCGAAVLLTAATLLFRSRRAFEIAWFWGVVGAANAVLTPGNLDAGFPDYRFFQYFTAHSGILAGVLFAAWGLGMRPTAASLWRAFAGLNLFALVVGGANLLLGSNYMFLSAPPPGTVSPFFAAPWPWYLPLLAGIGLAMFFVVLAPYLVADRLRRRRPADGREPA